MFIELSNTFNAEINNVIYKKLESLRRLIVIGTRGSKLALAQAHQLKAKLDALKLLSELKIINSKGDENQQGQDYLTKEIEEVLTNKKVDVAVHSLMDLPTENPDGLVIAGLSEREDPADVLIINQSSVDDKQTLQLKKEAIVGTSSMRRKSQLLSLNKNIVVKDLVGNIPNQIDKLSQGNFDAIVIAMSDVNRLDIDLNPFKVIRLHPKEFVPAPGQGVVAYQCRESDIEMRKILAKIHVRPTMEMTNVERTVLKLMDEESQTSLGVYCEVDKAKNYHATAFCQVNDNIKRSYVSQSTTFQLAERIVEELKN